MADISNTTQQIPLLTFRLAEQHYALLIDNVIEVAGMVELIVAPDSPQEVLGFANRHGEALPILDLRKIFLQEAKPISLATTFIVVEADGQKCGLVTDEVLTVEYVNSDQIQRGQQKQHFINGMIQHEQHLIQMVSVTALINNFLNNDVIENRTKSI